MVVVHCLGTKLRVMLPPPPPPPPRPCLVAQDSAVHKILPGQAVKHVSDSKLPLPLTSLRRYEGACLITKHRDHDVKLDVCKAIIIEKMINALSVFGVQDCGC